ncbi:MAG: dihydroorotase family protein [Candidatus Bathyarchaeia archaeon]|nr:dihydroorotase family protein [Candidatus Bathyarchaeota archaeon]
MIVDLILKDLKAYVNGAVQECCIAIKNGVVYKVGREAQMPKADNMLSLGGLLILPGLIDAHVHLRDEGKAYKEDFYTGTAAAAAGGFTTVLDMPNNTPVTMSAETLSRRMETAKRKILVNVGFYSEFPRRVEEIDTIIREGAVAFKLYLGEQIGGLNIDDDDALMEAFKTVASRVPISVHAEDKSLLRNVEERLTREGRGDVEAFLEVHSVEAEAKAVRRMVEIAEKTKAKVHFCHISTKDSLETIYKAKKAGLPITCEVTPHHLFLSAEDLKHLGAMALTAPPFRDKSHVDALWAGLRHGIIDILSSDHAPHVFAEKNAENVWGVKTGIPGLETSLPLMLTAVNAGLLGIADIVRLMAENPAKIFKLKGRGVIEEGRKADLVVVDLEREYFIDTSRFHSKAKFSPFHGKRVKGKPVKTFVGGRLVMDDGEIVAQTGCGEVILGGGAKT